MEPWFFRNPERLKLERTGIEELSRSAEWLIGVEWRIDQELCLDAIIRAHGHDYEVRLSFPTLYPDAPAVLRPRNMSHRVSAHQYGGADGPLCLEWGPDNWHRDVTAVQLLESAHRLFDVENPLGEDRPDVPVVAPSRHELTIGQGLRWEWARWYTSGALSEYLTAQPALSVGTFKFSFRKTGENWVSLVHEAMPFEGHAWRDEGIPTTMPEAGATDQYTGIWFKTELDSKNIGQPRKLAELQDLLAGLGGKELLAADGYFSYRWLPETHSRRHDSGSSRRTAPICHILRRNSCVVYKSPVGGGIGPSSFPRTGPVERQGYRHRRLGFAGSKIAVSLARMGVRKFYLVDHDVLLPENLQRHALDWQGVVQHKVDAMRLALDRVAPGTKVEVSRLHITGQESNAAVSGALGQLAACDVIIDATADPRVFNLLAAVARTACRPMIWMEVFGGGMGGLVARSRPLVDPTPQDMRSAYLQYCTDHPRSVLRVLENYAAETEDGEVRRWRLTPTSRSSRTTQLVSFLIVLPHRSFEVSVLDVFDRTDRGLGFRGTVRHETHIDGVAGGNGLGQTRGGRPRPGQRKVPA